MAFIYSQFNIEKSQKSKSENAVSQNVNPKMPFPKMQMKVICFSSHKYTVFSIHPSDEGHL